MLLKLNFEQIPHLKELPQTPENFYFFKLSPSRKNNFHMEDFSIHRLMFGGDVLNWKFSVHRSSCTRVQCKCSMRGMSNEMDRQLRAVEWAAKSNPISVSSVWKVSAATINWFSTFGFTLARNLTNVLTAIDASSNYHTSSSIRDYTLVSRV